MVIRIASKDNYLFDIPLEDLINIKTIPSMIVNLCGQDVEIYNDPWMWHLHIKVSNNCNGKCWFCVECGDSIQDNREHLLENLDVFIKELIHNDILFSVSVTGGEPTIYPEFEKLCKQLQTYNIPFLTLNTNGVFVEKYIDLIDNTFHFVNISRHRMNDSDNKSIFRTNVPTIKDLKRIKSKLNKCKLRIQCVFDKDCTIDSFNQFRKLFSFADDLSFRRLMELEDERYVINKENYRQILDYCLENFELVEQVIQDYYVYETYNDGSKNITFSYSNMKLLLQREREEKENICREFVIHPNGVVSKSWKIQSKILE